MIIFGGLPQIFSILVLVLLATTAQSVVQLQSIWKVLSPLLYGVLELCCDYIWWYSPGIYYAHIGANCYVGSSCGLGTLTLADTVGVWPWRVGAFNFHLVLGD